jgi:NAD(P)-dependent dehydrogenase (short-subunit alcohol dehydrogenase family)
MGAAEARLFAAEGAKVVIGDVLEAQGREVEAEIKAAGGEAVFVRLDVTNEADWQRAVETAVSQFGQLHILLAEWNRVMDINSTGVFLGTKTAIPAMRQAGGGSIVNISSQLGLVGVDNSSPQYQASKGSVRLLTKATAIQYAQDGIRVNSVHPGPIETPMTEARRSDPEVRALTLSRIPLGRYGQPDDVAMGVLYLASDEASFITGSELVIDGGWTAQ